MSPTWWSGSHQSGFAKAVVAVLVTDDEVIEQRHVEHVCSSAQAQRQACVVWTWCWIGYAKVLARVVKRMRGLGNAPYQFRFFM